MHGLAEEFSAVAEFKCVYISEAHAVDEWPISSARFAEAPVCIKQARTLEERAAAADAYVEAYNVKVPMLVAGMGGEFEAAYHPWPIRFYILSGERIAYVGRPIASAPDLEGFRNALLQLL